MSREARRAELAALLALRDREGLTYEELSERCGLAATTLSRWSGRLRREARDQPAFVQVELRDAMDAGRPPVGRSHMLVRRGNRNVEIGDVADPDQVRAILEVLVELPC